MSHERQCFLVFSSDVFCYHVAYIQEGIAQYLSKGTHKASFFPLGIEQLEVLFDAGDYQVGAIGLFDGEHSQAFFRERGIPFLNLGIENRQPEIGFTLRYDGEGRKAAQFFIEDLGLQHLGYYGMTTIQSHERRCHEFQEGAQVHGLEVSVLIEDRTPLERFFEKSASVSKRNMGALADLLKSLPKPAGIFCANDQMALVTKVQAGILGISVPDELSILGVGSLHRASGGWQEQVSVVQLDHHKLGFESARLMEEYLLTGTVPKSVYLKPDNIIHRYTTLRRSLSDSLTREAIARIQDDPSLSILQLCRSLNVSRRTLEVHFRMAGARSIGKTIEQERFNRARELLKNFRSSVECVADMSGYPDTGSMRRSFNRCLGMSPTDYRRSLKHPSR